MVPSTATVAQLDALRLTEAVRQRLVDFTADDNYVRDDRLSTICRRIWSGPPERGGLISDLWVEGAFPAANAPQTLDSLVKDGRFNADLCAQLDATGAVPRHRPLYMHQAEAMDKVHNYGPNGERPAVVITAATGAGKTESFLLPILNDLYEQHNTWMSGVRCLILYPMNALVNDQVDRLYTWLQGQDRLTLFHFTSETPEDRRSADRLGVPNWEACRIRTRREARGLETRNGQPVDMAHHKRVPDILITNYSMLEYMLCRPQDAIFFGPALRAVVLDEAHLYTGTLAAEITLLLRRVSTRCGVSADDVLQMATSATLGTGNGDELRTFARDIFSKQHIHVVQGRPTRVDMGPPSPPKDIPTASSLVNMQWFHEPLMIIDTNVSGAPALVKDPAMCSRLRRQLSLFVSDNAIASVELEEEHPAVLLYRVLRASPLLQSTENILWQRKRLPLRELAKQLWNSDDDVAMRATTILLHLGASARQQVGDYPLLPHRIHLLARPSAGLVVCLNGECSGPSAGKLNPLGSVAATSEDSCQYCSSAVISLCRCRNCGEWVLAGRLDGNRLRPVVTFQRDAQSIQFLTLRTDEAQSIITLNPATGERSGAGSTGVRMTPTTNCPQCGRETSDSEPFAGAFSTGAPLTLAILAETVLAELPPFPSKQNQWLPGRGRRMLAFSDSRQEAARLGPRLTRQHETQLIRAAIVRLLGEQPVADEELILTLRKEIENLEVQLAKGIWSGATRQYKEKSLRQLQQELEGYSVGGSVSDWSDKLSGHMLLHEVLDPQHGAKHYAHGHLLNGIRGWSQKEWDENWNQVRRQAQSLLAREFASPIRRAVSAETLGLVEVTYPGLDALEAPSDLIGRLPSREMREQLAICWPTFMHDLCDTLRSDGVITLGDDQEDRAYQFGSVYLGKWMSEHHAGPGLERFVGTTTKQRRRLFAAAVISACGMASETIDQWSKDILSAAFRQLHDYAHRPDQSAWPGALIWLQRTDRQADSGAPVQAIRIIFPHLGLRHPRELYRCTRTGHVWVRSVLGCAPEQGCNGTLSRVDESDLDNDPKLARQRREYRESPIFQIGLWAEEHSAQLSPQENRRLQDLFKAGIRNILSATTTLELGIDIGGLNAVLMGNVPPGKANYLQRAGRAGRRADGSSIVVTYARPRPFDNEVFQHIGEYLDRPLHRPLVLLDRARVVRRHFHSYLLGEFFRAVYPAGAVVGAMQAFGTMGGLCGAARPPYWRSSEVKPTVEQPQVEYHVPPGAGKWWNSSLRAPGLEAQFLQFLFYVRDWNEEGVRPTAERLLAGTIIESELDDWDRLLDTVIEDFASAIENWRKDYDYLLSAWYKADQKAQANAIRYQLTALYDITLIEGLADHQFLPHYGFPIGVHKLRVIAPDSDHPGRIRDEDQYRLERGSLLALREYVPGSQLLVGSKLVTSHGLLKHWSGANLDTYIGLHGQCCTCSNEHFFYWIGDAPEGCPICGEPPQESPRHMLLPRHGFSGAAWDPPKWSTDVDLVGTAETATMTFTQRADPKSTDILENNFAGIEGLTVRYREHGDLLVYNSGEYKRGFAICLSCGYADSERHTGSGAMKLPSGFTDHAPLTSTSRYKSCWKAGQTHVQVLRNQVLAARETTDVVLVDFSGCLTDDFNDESLVTTLGYALQHAGAQMLELDTREIGILIVPTGERGKSHGVVLYDNVAGGAGHVPELLKKGRDWFHVARAVMYVDEAHHQRCETACLNCLLSFDAQTAMSRNLLIRRTAIAVLDRLLDSDGADSSPVAPRNPNNGDSASALGDIGQQLSTSERLKRAQSRLQTRQR